MADLVVATVVVVIEVVAVLAGKSRTVVVVRVPGGTSSREE